MMKLTIDQAQKLMDILKDSLSVVGCLGGLTRSERGKFYQKIMEQNTSKEEVYWINAEQEEKERIRKSMEQ